MNSRLAAFRAAGQSVWLDSLSRGLLSSGELDRALAAERQLAMLASLGIDAGALADELQRQGIDRFAASYAEAVNAVASLRTQAPHGARERAAPPRA